jgi:catechol 2,3-dioxygenase-like lactoylglutathione lyase family enzyme
VFFLFFVVNSLFLLPLPFCPSFVFLCFCGHSLCHLYPASSGAGFTRFTDEWTAMNQQQPPPSLAGAHLRVARPTDDIAALLRFYVDGLGFALLGGFEDHDGFDGAMLGHPGAPYHLEFTTKRGHAVGRSPSKEHLLVFYLPDEAAWNAARDRMARAGFAPVASWNPYWDKAGATYEDPDGYRVVLQRAAWSNG